jgi:uncharacterized protein YndB with AHSA1/START domain
MQTENNLGTSVHKHSTPKSDLIQMQRDFDVPVERLFAAFKTPDAIKSWWWPKGLYSDRVEMDFRNGGHYFISMKGVDRGGAGMTGNFEEIVENSRIVMTDYFSDQNGHRISAAEANMPGDWPEEAYVTFEFSPLAGNKSRLMMYQQGIPNELQDDCIAGWDQMFDKLEECLYQARH